MHASASNSAPDGEANVVSQDIKKSRCPICRSVGEPLSSQWPHSQCAACRHVWVDGSGPSADNEYFESDDYAQWRTESDTLRQRQVEMAAERIDWLGTLADSAGRLLEFGCSTGEASAALADRGWTAAALDPSAPAIEIATQRYPAVDFGVGITPTEAGLIDPDRSDASGNGAVDLVMAFHVLEHIPDVHGFVELVAETLQPGGHLYLRVPNWDSWSRRLFGDRWPDNMAEHLHHFSRPSMTRLLAEHRFDVERMETKGQSRSWIGGVRRLISSEWNATETMPTTGDRSQTILKAANTIGRPLFAIEERCDAGSELLVLARLAD
jgi:2-polyprenyl-3-methyl-5-hydroxy-6-metoxy-1,4-benzoquinol methylase